MSELQEQIVQVTFSTTKLSLRTMLSAIRKLLDQIKQHKERQNSTAHGEQSLRKLNLQGKELESVPIDDRRDLQRFRRQLNRYAVDFSVKRDRKTGEYSVFFKGQDSDRIYTALEKVVKTAVIDRDNRRPMRDVLRAAIEKADQRNHASQAAREASRNSPDRGHDSR